MSTTQPELLSLSTAESIFRRDVPRQEIARYYLKSELPNLLVGDPTIIGEIVDTSVDALPEKKLWKQLEAHAYTDRMNGVFQTITDESISWAEVQLPIDAITLTGIAPHINDIVYASPVDRNPLAFAAYLNDYFAKHTDAIDDPTGLNEFRIRDEPIRHATLLTTEHDGKVNMLDGSHRLIAMAMLGKTSIQAFAALPNGREPLSMIGDGIILTLQKLHATLENSSEQTAVKTTSALLTQRSTDGEQAVQSYWIDHPRTDTAKAAGKDVLAAVKRLRRTEQ